MYKKSYFRGLGTGLVIGALTMTVAFNFGNAGKTDSGQGKTAVVSQQQDKSTDRILHKCKAQMQILEE